MPKELCYCKHFHCEQVVEKIGENYEISSNQRFRFVKDNDGVITDKVIIKSIEYKGGIVDGIIPDCPIRRDLVKEGKDPTKHSKVKKEKKHHKK